MLVERGPIDFLVATDNIDGNSLFSITKNFNNTRYIVRIWRNMLLRQNYDTHLISFLYQENNGQWLQNTKPFLNTFYNNYPVATEGYINKMELANLIRQSNFHNAAYYLFCKGNDLDEDDLKIIWIIKYKHDHPEFNHSSVLYLYHLLFYRPALNKELKKYFQRKYIPIIQFWIREYLYRPEYANKHQMLF